MEYRKKTQKKNVLSQKKSLPNLIWGVSGQMDCFSSDPDRMVHHGPESMPSLGLEHLGGGGKTEQKQKRRKTCKQKRRWRFSGKKYKQSYVYIPKCKLCTPDEAKCNV